MNNRNNYLQFAALGGKNEQKERESTNLKDEYKIIFVRTGGLTITISERKFTVAENSLIFLAPGQQSMVHSVNDSLLGDTLIFDTDYFLLCLKNQVKLCFYPFFQFSGHPILQLTKVQWDNLSKIKRKIAFEIGNRESLNDDLLCRLYLNVLLIEIERIYNFNEDVSHTPTSRKHLITARFKKLVEKNFLQLRKVSEYAEQLYITPTYLNDTVKAVTGYSASSTIKERLIQEIKGELIQTEATINELAYKLGFNDVSYFCRFFKNNTGMSPQVFRETNHFSS